MTLLFLDGVTLGPLKPGPPTSEVTSPALTRWALSKEPHIFCVDEDHSPPPPLRELFVYIGRCNQYGACCYSAVSTCPRHSTSDFATIDGKNPHHGKVKNEMHGIHNSQKLSLMLISTNS